VQKNTQFLVLSLDNLYVVEYFADAKSALHYLFYIRSWKNYCFAEYPEKKKLYPEIFRIGHTMGIDAKKHAVFSTFSIQTLA
jgi:hypothetical protein